MNLEKLVYAILEIEDRDVSTFKLIFAKPRIDINHIQDSFLVEYLEQNDYGLTGNICTLVENESEFSLNSINIEESKGQNDQTLVINLDDEEMKHEAEEVKDLSSLQSFSQSCIA